MIRPDRPPPSALAQRSGEPPRVLTVQDGSRLNYTIPVALARAGILERTFTEWYSAPGSLALRVARALQLVRPALARRIIERHHPALAPALVRSDPWLAVRHQLARVRSRDLQQYHRWRATTVTEWIQREGFGRANVLHGFISNLDPSLVRRAVAQGLLTIGDQIIAPAEVRSAEQQLQLERWPDWESGPILTPERTRSMARWEQQTWQALDHITCPSPYVRGGLQAAGVDPARITMLPYPCTFPIAAERAARPVRRPTVGFVGAVGLRKGSPYFVEVARRFGRSQASFVMVGNVRLTDRAARSARAAVDLIGRVPRSAVRDWLARFDLFFFPSTCEGSASAVAEAMAAGLPVVTSANSGSIVRDGEDGYLVPYDDLDRAEARIAALIADPDLRRSMGEAARRRVAALDLDWYGAELAALIGRLHAARTSVGDAHLGAGGGPVDEPVAGAQHGGMAI